MPGDFAFLDFGVPALLILLALVVVLFDGKKLSELSRNIGMADSE